ncbi:MAG: zinc ribbon domain-containing protein [Dehalococcoidia bacterium]
MDSISWPGGSWEATLALLLVIGGIYTLALWATLIFWTYRDIRQRTRDLVIQTVAVMLVALFFLPGHWIYLIVRPRYTLTELYERSLEEEALLQELEDQKSCPTCKRRVYEEYLICPSCRTQLKEPCRSCAKPLSYAWMACPFCGLEKPPREVLAPRPARPALSSARAANGRQAPPSRPAVRGPEPVRTRPQAVPATSGPPQRRTDPFDTPARHDPFATPARQDAPAAEARPEPTVTRPEPPPEPRETSEDAGMIDATSHEAREQS